MTTEKGPLDRKQFTGRTMRGHNKRTRTRSMQLHQQHQEKKDREGDLYHEFVDEFTILQLHILFCNTFTERLQWPLGSVFIYYYFKTVNISDQVTSRWPAGVTLFCHLNLQNMRICRTFSRHFLLENTVSNIEVHKVTETWFQKFQSVDNQHKEV